LWERATQKFIFLVLHQFFFNWISNSCVTMYAALDQGHEVQSQDCNNFVQFSSLRTRASAQLSGFGGVWRSHFYHGQSENGRGMTSYGCSSTSTRKEGSPCWLCCSARHSGVAPTFFPGSHGCRWRGRHCPAAWPWTTSSISVRYIWRLSPSSCPWWFCFVWYSLEN
jgi:hypothetical protein